MALFEGNWPLALGISIAAGLATMIGSFVLFLPKRIRERYLQLILAIALSFASGVMLYVSFAEIYFKSLNSAALGLDTGLFCSSGYNGAQEAEITSQTEIGFTFPPHWTVSLLSNGLLFAGMWVAIILDWVVHLLAPELEELHEDAVVHALPDSIPPLQEVSIGSPHNSSRRSSSASSTPNTDSLAGCPPEPQASPLLPPIELMPYPIADPFAQSSANADLEVSWQPQRLEAEVHIAERTPGEVSADEGSAGHLQPDDNPITEPSTAELSKPPVARSKLHNLGMLSVLAIGLHNLPEGLATFSATIEEPSLGLPLAIGIALHNIPEGICVAVPIYYATNSRKRALLWTFVSAVLEPIGGILGYMALKNVIGDLAFAIIFGLVAGMMIHIVIHEYLPTCHALKVPKMIIIVCSMAGMAVMWLSIFILNL